MNGKSDEEIRNLLMQRMVDFYIAIEEEPTKGKFVSCIREDDDTLYSLAAMALGSSFFDFDGCMRSFSSMINGINEHEAIHANDIEDHIDELWNNRYSKEESL